MSDEAEKIARVHQALQDLLGGRDEPGADQLGILRRFIVIAEWTDEDGEEWITRFSGDLNGELASAWSIMGLLQYTLDKVRLCLRSGEDE